MWKVGVGFLFIILIQFIQISQGENVTCAENEFTCKNGECILAKWKCDAEADCLDSSDEKKCESYPSCTANEFQCNTSKECVPDTWRCDGANDCADRSDELGCYFPACTEEQFRCKNNYCIKQSYVCDGDDDCYDFSDEISCPTIVRCKENEFLCDLTECYSNTWLCDNDPDCLDGTDEMNCTKCLPDNWKCGNGDCIAAKHICDGENDCSDMTDEINCPNVTIICDEKTQFQCTSGPCIKSEWVCDGYADCPDSSDENNCTEDNSTTCSRTQYHCWNDECIEANKVCDQKIDCQDGSDEFRCPSRENQTSCSTNRGGCQHFCHDHDGFYQCSCYEGFDLDKHDREKKRCKDTDECGIAGFCSQKCVNGHGNYNCSCNIGYALQSDGRKCKALGSKPLLLLSNQAGIKIATLDNPSKIQVSMDDLKNVVAVDYWLEGKLIFWTDTVLRTIKSASLSGTQIKNVVKFGLERPCGLAVDWLGRKLFWADSESGRIEVSNFDGAERKAIYWQPLGRLRAIALHPSKGYIFWTEWEVEDQYAKSSIVRANMDGTNPRRILYKDMFWPNSLVVDYAIGRLFYVDAKTGLIALSDFDGRKIRVIMKNNILQPFSITLFQDELFWTDTASAAIFRAKKFDGTGFKLVKRNMKSPMGISVIQSSRQPSGSYNCEIDNGECSHICLPTSFGRTCTCPTGFQMLNSTHCAERIKKFVCYVGDYVVRQVSLDTDDMLEVVLPFENVLDVIAMDWDPINDEMYWAESYNDEITIRKGKMRPPFHEAVVQKIPSRLSSICVDWLTRKLYWSEEERNHILVSNLDGSSATVVVWRKNVKPRNLLLDVEKRYMYWTSHGSVVCINSAGMDGSFRKKIVSSGLVNPTDLTLDKAKDTLYWVDGGNIVHYISLETKKRKFFTVSHHSVTLNPFSIGVDGDRFFWADSKLKKVLVMKPKETNEGKVIGKYKFNPARLAVFEQVKRQEGHPCAINNGDCSHLCVLSPSQNFRCLCPAGRSLKADNKTCENATTISRFMLVNSDGRLHQVPLSVQYKTDIIIPSEGNQDIFAFDVDVKHRSVYLIKKTTKKKEICYVSLFGGNYTCILSEVLRAPGDIAYDPVGQHIYWTDFLTKKIYLADRKGQFWTVVIWKDLDLPSSVTVAYKHGLIFWADLGKQISISRANMDGSFQSKIVTSRLKWPNSLTVDHMAKHLYWTDYLQQRIELCDFDGKNRRQFVRTLAGSTFITLFSKFVYWSEWQPKVLRKRGKAQNGPSITVMKSLKRVTGIQAVNFRKIPVSKSKCNQNNGDCSHFCLMNTFGISCACPVGLKLQNDNKTCSDTPRKSIFYSTGRTIKRISLDTDDMTSILLPFEYGNIAENFAFDVTTDKIYWTNGTKIYSSFTNDSDAKTVVTAPMSSIKSLSVDWISGNLFWTDSANGKIKVSNLDGSLVADLISYGLKKPRDIVVDPIKGILFWTDTERKVIETSHTNGQSRIVIASRAIYHPVGLAVDIDTQTLYWTDAMYHTIERCSYDGHKRFTVISRDVHAFALAVMGPHVYWTDQRQNALLRANKETGDQRDVLEKDLERPMQVVSLSRRRKTEASACFKSGSCKNLCLSTPNGRSCASVCDGKLYLKDSCNVERIATQPTFLIPSINCTIEADHKNCTDRSVESLTKEKKTVKIAYIVGGIVLVAFIIAMSILIFLCQRRLKKVLGKGKQKQLIPLRVTFDSRRSMSKTDSVNDPLVSLPSKCPDQVSTTSSPSSMEKFPNHCQVKSKNECEEAKQCLTISNV